jgi:HSP20 family protein
MGESSLKPERFRPNIYVLEETASPNPEPMRWRLHMRSHVWRPPTDVYEVEDALVVRVEIAGMRESDFAIYLDGQSLAIRGVRPDITERRAYHQMEIRFGEFATEVELPYQVIVDEIQATYTNGFLRILLPKARPQQIDIEEG